MVDKLALYDRTKECWPDTVCLRGAKIYDENCGEIPVINDVYDCIESSIDGDNRWLQISTFAFHVVLWRQALEAVREGRKTVGRDAVTFDLFDHKLRDSLQGEGWSDLRVEYSNSNQ